MVMCLVVSWIVTVLLASAGRRDCCSAGAPRGGEGEGSGGRYLYIYCHLLRVVKDNLMECVREGSAPLRPLLQLPLLAQQLRQL